ncbi:MAG: siroheme synthase CysG [Alphaproteobacteria bacterium]|nr:siroheme synthase CysG [Alphaproteobacteria bacterium]
MQYFPLHMDLRLADVLVVGGDGAALNRIELLLAAGARVSVIARTPVPAILDLAGEGQLRLVMREFAPEDVREAALVIATDDGGSEVQAVSVAARAARVPVNVVDRPELSNFIMPAIVERGEIVIGISTGGSAPVLARRLRERIEALLPARLGELASFAGQFRDAVRAVLPDFGQRRRFWERFFDGPVAEAVLSGDQRAARERMLPLLNRGEPRPAEGGTIMIVGAGPGDPDLLTLRALQLMQSADVVLHDELVSREVLARVRRDAERIHVGKQAGRSGMTQEEINALLVREARRGRRVLRLKGGDPFIFGRGGEEVEHARRHGFEPVIVPGITAALGAAAATGLPLTHRHVASGVALVTGHDKDGEAGADWEVLARSGQTIVVYMGRRHAARIAERLIAGGLSSATAVAVIRNATRPDQTVATGLLSDLADLAAGLSGEGPALLVVGDVVRLARDWAPASLLWTAAW